MPRRRELARTGAAGRIARDMVEEFAGELGAGPTEVAKLLVTEMATNAVRHGRGRITLEITVDSDQAYVAVEDEGEGGIAIRPEPDQNGGYGLQFVDQLAESWGVEAGRARVWFTLATEVG